MSNRDSALVATPWSTLWGIASVNLSFCGHQAVIKESFSMLRSAIVWYFVAVFNLHRLERDWASAGLRLWSQTFPRTNVDICGRQDFDYLEVSKTCSKIPRSGFPRTRIKSTVWTRAEYWKTRSRLHSPLDVPVNEPGYYDLGDGFLWTRMRSGNSKEVNGTGTPSKYYFKCWTVASSLTCASSFVTYVKKPSVIAERLRTCDRQDGRSELRPPELSLCPGPDW